MISAPSPPPVYQPPVPVAPDPYATANAQQGYNINSAIAQNQLNNTNQQTPFGSISYDQTGGSFVGGSPGTPDIWQVPNGPNDPNFALGGMYAGAKGFTAGQPATQGTWVPTYTATTQLSPGLQNLYNSNLGNAQQSSGLESQLMTNAQQQLTHPLDLSWGATEQKLWDINKHTLDPQWSQNQTELDQKLQNQGLSPGSAQYGYQQGQFGLNKSNAYDQALLQGHQAAVNDLTSQYNSPLNNLNALRTGSQVSQPGVMPAQSSQANISAAPYAQTANANYGTQANLYNSAGQLGLQSYTAQQNANQAAMGGLFGLGSSLIGSIAPIGGLLGLSDERDKTDRMKLGKDPATGLEMEAYRYKDDPKTYPKVVGPMAQEVEKKAPGSTFGIGGHRVIGPEAMHILGPGRKAA